MKNVKGKKNSDNRIEKTLMRPNKENKLRSKIDTKKGSLCKKY